MNAKKISRSQRINKRNHSLNSVYKNKCKNAKKQILKLLTLPNLASEQLAEVLQLFRQYTSLIMKMVKKNIISKQSAGRQQKKLHKQCKQLNIPLYNNKI